MEKIKNATSLIVAVAAMGLILLNQHAYHKSISNGSVVSANGVTNTDAGTPAFSPGAETIAMK